MAKPGTASADEQNKTAYQAHSPARA
jgi:hypothetical protein